MRLVNGNATQHTSRRKLSGAVQPIDELLRCDVDESHCASDGAVADGARVTAGANCNCRYMLRAQQAQLVLDERQQRADNEHDVARQEGRHGEAERLAAGHGQHHKCITLLKRGFDLTKKGALSPHIQHVRTSAPQASHLQSRVAMDGTTCSQTCWSAP